VRGGHVAWATERSRSLTAGYGSRGCGEEPPSAPPLAIEIDYAQCLWGYEYQ